MKVKKENPLKFQCKQKEANLKYKAEHQFALPPLSFSLLGHPGRVEAILFCPFPSSA